MSDLSHSLLGKDVAYPKVYAPEVLFAIDRAHTRQLLSQHIGGPLPVFYGQDVWQAYEISWLNNKGCPVVACAILSLPADSPCMVESKSLKLYLNSLNHHQFIDAQAVKQCIEKDLSNIIGAAATVTLLTMQESAAIKVSVSPYDQAVCLDELDVSVSEYSVNSDLLNADNATQKTETLSTHLFRSCCPVTAQPDWASIYIDYSGPAINHAALLKYLISFRENQEFHEQCIERVFSDIWLRCQPQRLLVLGCYLRRGGVDINPVRSSQPIENVQLPFLVRQ